MKEIVEIFIKSLKLYFENFAGFLKYMSFPVLGQLVGWIWIFGITYFYIGFLPKMLNNNILNNFSVIFFILLIITLPGLFIMLKAFWEYLIAYGAINSMIDGLIKSSRVYDFPAHNEVIIRKTPKFIGLWLLISLLGLIFLFPLLWIPAVIVFVYFVLVFQVFVFEPDENIIGCFKRSFSIIKGKFGKTFILMMLIGIFSYWFLPWIFSEMLKVSKLIDYMVIPFDSLVNLLPINELNNKLPVHITSLMVATGIVISLVNYIIIGFTLPLRTICWGLWYKKHVKAKSKIDNRILKRAEE